MANKRDVSGSSLGYTPSTANIRARVQGETEDEYKRYVKLSQGQEARQLADARGIDTSGMFWDGKAFKDADERHWYSDPGVIGPIAVGASTLGFGALHGMGSAAAGQGASQAAQAAPTMASEAGGGILPSANIAVPNAVARSVTTGAGTGGGNGMLGSLGKLFGKGGLDPTMLLLSGLSMFGGGEGRQSFKGKGTADPVAMLQAALARNEAMGQSLQNRGPARLRSSAVSAPPQPVNLPGLGLQIGGGLGTDPALADPTLLEGRGLSDMTNQPYPQRQAPRQAQRRNPSNG